MRQLAQFVAIFFAVIVIIKSWADYRASRESARMFLFWLITWCLVAGIAFYPDIIDYGINRLGGQRGGVGTLIGMGLVFVLFILYRLYVKMERIERELTKLIKNLALRELRK